MKKIMALTILILAPTISFAVLPTKTINGDKFKLNGYNKPGQATILDYYSDNVSTAAYSLNSDTATFSTNSDKLDGYHASEIIAISTGLTPTPDLSNYQLNLSTPNWTAAFASTATYAQNSNQLGGYTTSYFLNTSSETQTKSGNLNVNNITAVYGVSASTGIFTSTITLGNVSNPIVQTYDNGAWGSLDKKLTIQAGATTASDTITFNAKGIGSTVTDYQTIISNESDLVSYWKMDNDWLDSKGTNHLTAAGGATFGTAKYGSNSGSFTQVSSQYATKDSGVTGVGGGTAISFEAWVYKNSAGTNQAIFAAGQNNTAQEYHLYFQSDNTIRVDFGGNKYWVGLTNNAFAATGVWYHIVATYDYNASTKIHIYVNGVDQSITTGGGGAPSSLYSVTQFLRIGSMSGGGGAPGLYFDGLIDEMAVYNTALTVAKITEHYNSSATYAVPRTKVHFTNSGLTGVDSYSDGDIYAGSGNTKLKLTPSVADSASAVAHTFDTENTLATVGSAHTKWLNAGTELMRLSPVGLGIGTTLTPQLLNLSGTNAKIIINGTTATDFAQIQFNQAAVGQWAFGTDSSATQKFLLYDIKNSATRLSVDSNGTVMIGNTAAALGARGLLNVYQNDSGVGSNNGIIVEQAGTGDAIAQFLLTGVRRWVMGVDNSDSDKFGISPLADLANKVFTLDTTGNLGLGVNATGVPTRLNVYGPITSSLFPFNSIFADDTTAYNANPGGAIAFGYKYNAAGTIVAYGAGIGAVKSNTIDGDSSGDLVFYTRVNGESQVRERLRCNTTGYLGIGTSTPSEKLEVSGNIKSTALNTSSITVTGTGIIQIGNSVNSVIKSSASYGIQITTNVDIISGMILSGRVRPKSVWHVVGGTVNANTSISIASPNTWYKITNATGDLFQGSESDGFSLSTDSMVVINSGDYSGSVKISYSGLTGADWSFRIRDITTGITTMEDEGTSTTGDTNVVANTMPIYLGNTRNNIYILEVQRTSGAGDLTIHSSKFYIQYLHD